MKYVKILGLLAVGAAVMMAFAASASATTVTTKTSAPESETPTIHAENEKGHVVLANPNGNIECNSTVEGKVESHGAGVTAKGKITKLQFTGCTGWTDPVVKANGELEVHWTKNYEGTLTSTGTTVSVTKHTIFGPITCSYLTNNTPIGTVTGGNPATLHINAEIPVHNSPGVCGSGAAKWSGSYVTTSSVYIKS